MRMAAAVALLSVLALPRETRVTPPRPTHGVWTRHGVALLRGPGWAAKICGGTVHLTTGAGDLRYRLSSVRAGSDVLFADDGHAPRLEADGDRVTLRRGPVDEFYDRLNDGLEQSFRIAERPAAGDLEIRGALDTDLARPTDGASGAALAFGAAITVDRCAVIDARGAKLALPLTMESGALVIRVPAAWLASAEFPVVVDPVLGPTVTVDSGIASMYWRNVDVAYNAVQNHYFVVWNEQFSGSDYDVWAARIDASTGALVPPTAALPNPNPLDIDANAAGEASVAWNPTTNQYLTAYRHLVTGALEQDQIRARITNGDGTNFPGPDGATPANTGFEVNDDQLTASSDRNPDVAAVGSGWRVVWAKQTFSGSVTGAIWARDVAGVATFATASYLVQDSAALVEQQPCIAHDATTGTSLIAWGTGLGPGTECYAMTATAASPPSLGPLIAVTGSNGLASTSPRMAVSPGQFLVVWTEYPSFSPLDVDVHGVRVSSAGTVIGSPNTLVTGTNQDSLPDAAYNPATGKYIVAWHSLTGATGVMATVYDAGTFTLQEGPVTLAAGTAINPACAASTTSGESLIVWRQPSGTTISLDSTRFALPAGTLLPPPAPPAGLAQSDQPGGPAAPVGYVDADGTLAFRASIAGAGRIDVEVKPNAAAFDGLGLVAGGAVPAGGGVSEATWTATASGDYRWRARAVDASGATSSWVEFDPSVAPDVTVAIAPPPPPPPPPPASSHRAHRACGGSAEGSGWALAVLGAVLGALTIRRAR